MVRTNQGMVSRGRSLPLGRVERPVQIVEILE